VLDPIKEIEMSEDKRIYLSQFFNKRIRSQDLAPWTLLYPDTVVQKDGRSCGPFLCHFAQTCIEGGDLTQSVPELVLREHILNTIQGKSVYCNILKRVHKLRVTAQKVTHNYFV